MGEQYVIVPLLWWRSCRLLSVPSPKRLRRRCTAKSLSANSDFCRFRALQCCFPFSCRSWWEGGTHLFLVERGFCFTGAFLLLLFFFYCLYLIIQMYWQPPGEKKTIQTEVWSWISEEQELKCDLLACHLGPSRSLVFLRNDWAQFVRDGWLVSKGLCKILFLVYFFCQSLLLQF